MNGQVTGLIHLYCGDGKGKTSAAAGLALRMAGAGKPVIFAQFYKDGSSSELRPLREMGVSVMNCKTVPGFFFKMNEAEREQVRIDYGRFLEEVFSAAQNAGLLVLDEVVSACRNGTVEENRLLRLLEERPVLLEVVLTGRGPSPRLLETADYITEMKKLRHPYDQGIAARRGVEY